MVFESVVTDVLNRVLGSYIENLDSKQLNLGIWGGDVVLKDLVLKPSALDDLNLPVQIVYGRLSQLVLKIPWKNLYTSAVEAKVEGLYLLVVPNQQVKYDQEKDRTEHKKNKEKELQKIEDAKKKEAEKGVKVSNGQVVLINSVFLDKPKPDDSFTEKLTMQIIKNVQVKIENIHLRYEDKVTHVNHPFAMGVTLSNLSLETTDDTWTPTIVQETVLKFFKVLNLEGLSIYWNCGSSMYQHLPLVELLSKFRSEIGMKSNLPPNYQYILGPVYASARLRLNPKPDCDTPQFTIPKVHLNLEMEKLHLGINRSQYRDIIALADSMDRMTKGVPYRKYRPELTSYKSHYKEWWLFAYNAVLDDVRRRRRNWSWEHMKAHRLMCENYAKLYQQKLTQKKLSSEAQVHLQKYEEELDIFNIVVTRQKIEVEVARLGKLNAQKEKKSWFSSWWGGGSEGDKSTNSDDIVKKLEEAMTPDEKVRLYQAIGYQENSTPLEFPEAYIDNSCTFILRLLEIQVEDDSLASRVLSIELTSVKCRVETRAAASALKVAVAVDALSILGVEQDELIPKMVSSVVQPGESGHLLDVLFETNPLDKLCDQRLHVKAKPIQIVYDAMSINNTVSVFSAPQSSALEQLSVAAGNGLNNFKEMSAVGLQHAIEQHNVIDLKIDLCAPYILLPYGGKYTGVENLLVANLGHIRIASLERSDTNVSELHAKGQGGERILEEMITQSYDRFELNFTELQILLVQGDEDWLKLISSTTLTPSHLLCPLNLSLTFHKCLIIDDPRLPLAKIRCHLPSITLHISDVRLILLLNLVTSIPFPEENIPENKPLMRSSRSHTSSQSLIKYLDLDEKLAVKPSAVFTPPEIKDLKGDLIQMTSLDAQFIMETLQLVVNHQEDAASPNEEILNLKICQLEAGYVQQTFNKDIVLKLGSINCGQMRHSTTIPIVNTPLEGEKGSYLIKVNFIQVNKLSPEFHTKHQSCESRLILNFTKLNVTLHQEGLLALLKFGTDLQTQIEDVTSNAKGESYEEVGKIRRLSSVAESFVSDLKASKTATNLLNVVKKKKSTVIETIQFKLNANLEELSLFFATDKSNICSTAINRIFAEVIVKESYTQIIARLGLIAVTDLNEESIHSQILTVTGEEVANLQVVMYNSEHKSPDNIDMSVQLSLGCLRFVFLNWFLSNMLNFVNNFQTAKQAIIDASQTAAEAASNNVQNAYKNSTRISLSINLQAPVIIIPVDSKSNKALLIDLGYLTILNKFNTLNVVGDHGENAVLDEMKLKLTNLTIASVILNTAGDIAEKIALLDPVTFTLSIKRNLSSAWYKSIPDIDLSGKINSITVLLAQTDFKMIMSILDGNLSEGDKQDALPPEPKQDASITRKLGEIELTVANKELESDLKVHTTIKFTLTMESFIINLFFKGSQKVGTNLSPTHDPKDALARFSLEVLSIKGRILSDNSIATSILLVNCLLDDTRKGREGKLTRLMERKADLVYVDQPSSSMSTESLEPVRSMIDITVQMKANDMFVDVRIFSFTIIISCEYLLKVAEFFTNSLAKDEKQITKPTNGKHSAIAKPAEVKKEFVGKKKESTDSTITLNLRIEKPDIILVEHMETIDANALILNNEILMKVRLYGESKVINGSISDIHLYTCCYNPSKRAETRKSVLLPVSISIAGSTPEGQGLHIEVCVTNICICVSPSTIELLSRAAASLSSGDVSQSESEVELVDHSDAWNAQKFREEDCWFLKAEIGEDVLEVLDTGTPESPRQKLSELCIVSIPSVVITIEAGVGNKTLPMLLLNSSFQGNVHDWSSQLYIDASLTLQMSYYNSMLAVWESLIEPVQVVHENKTVYEPWALRLEVTMNERDDVPISISEEVEEDEECIQLQPAAMTIDVSSTSNLELTVTKTSIDVLNNLAKAFSSAMMREPIKGSEITAPYVVKNESGLRVQLHLQNGAFKMYGRNDDLAEVVLEIGASVPLQLTASLEMAKDLQLTGSLKIENRCLNVEILDLLDCRLELPVVRSDKRYFLLKHRGENNDSWGLVSAVTIDEGVTTVTLRSILQVHNHFHVNVDVYYMTARGNELECISSVEPGSFINIPLNAVYTPTNELFFSVPDFSVTNTPFIWKDLKLNVSITKIMHCMPTNEKTNAEPFIIKVIGETQQIYHENTNRHTMASTCYNIHLHPAVTFRNCLPIKIICSIQNLVEEKVVEPGESLHMPNVNPGCSRIIVRLPDYLDKEWSCQHDVPTQPPPFTVWQFESYDSACKTTLDLGMHSITKSGSTHMILYCPFWMLNKTGLTISYRPSGDNLNVLHHPATFKGPVLFSFNAKNFFGKKKASIRIDQGEWCDKFSLDVAGSSGFVACKLNNAIYQIGVHNQLTYNGLTKQVTFTPYYVIVNNAPFDVECQEFDRPADAWVSISGKSCIPFWPRSEREDKLLKLRVVGTREVSAPFLYTETHITLLKLHNKFGGVNVDIQITEGGVYINLYSYEPGMAPAVIVNHTKDIMCIWEKETVQLKRLSPGYMTLYAWENPSGPKVLVWDIGHKKEMEDDLRKDGVGEFSPSDNTQVYWVSFLDGLQRVLLFTLDKSVAENVQCAKQFEAIQQEINVLIHGLGLSLVNNVTRQEILYAGIASSGITWETCKMHTRRWKQLGNRESLAIESAYQSHLNHLQVSGTSSGHVVVDSNTEVDFETGFMFRPNKRRLRRSFQTGLWLQLKTSPLQLQLHAKINRLQIDNQMQDCIFPVVLAPVPPPKTVASDVQKPFAELSIVQRIIKYSQIRQFKYFKVLIQEFHVKVDLGFVNAVVELLQNDAYSETEEKEQFLQDKKLVDEPLLSLVASKSLQEQKNFYDLLHFSPLKVHVSFSLQAGGGSPQGTPNFINVLLQGLGVTLTDMQDVVFRLAYFERDYTFLTQKQLISEATTHYVGQAVKQLYVLVLGLDVLGNPYGLVLGITKGVEDLFYEPFQGAIQGPGEFAEGLVLGVRSLFGHTVGGAAGAVSRITGALGKGIAALTFDDEYQSKRRDQINKKPATVQEGIARGGKGLVMGIFDGVTGVFTKPISGAKEEGIEGFFKGIGKGAVGLVARPTAGVIDFASGSLDAVKRATELGEETNRLRHPRFIQADGLVQPYKLSDAVGHKLLMDLEKGKYAHTDIYCAHYIIVLKKEVLLITDKRIAYIVHNDIFGGWQVEWSYTLKEIKPPPMIVSKGVSISTNEQKKKKIFSFGSKDSGKIIIISDPELREEVCNKIDEQLRSLG
ncbi:vacuolar protein sorting-associated protein 13 isoform X2 [Photinus pyralis]|uniref:vacuolar protein sorting-associated protein 13 isoform X2 n=1 Tax=Photinus pyralis TaxID=7054 RepID=UPI0012673346|nr:vacuolar protein sorting-associated protein 13 isoform X2 [Photinus pyralis]